MTRMRITGWMAAGLAATALAGCDENGNLRFLQQEPAAATEEIPANAGSRVLEERDVEAPDVFQAEEAGLWDGRPSLGGVWVAHPDVDEPERVIIRNKANGRFVIGALFRREREIPGPRLQASSDAAEALGMLAGQPVELSVIALRREEVPAEDLSASPALTDAPLEDGVAPAAAGEITAAPLDPIASAAEAIEAATPVAPVAAADVPAPPAAPAPQPSSLAKPYIQVGIFSVEANAERTANTMRSAGIIPTIKRGSTSGKAFWRVIVGPASNSAERADLLDKVKKQGFTDAYFVSN